MKKMLFLIVLLLILPYCSGQDVITTKDNRQLTVLIAERTGSSVSYHLMDYPGGGPLITMNLRQVKSIKYANGLIDQVGNENPRINKPLGISVGVGVDPEMEEGYFEFSTDFFVIPQVDLELNIGLEGEDYTFYYAAGGTAHLNRSFSKSGFTPYAGVLAGAYQQAFMVQVPVGISYITKFGFSTTFRVSPMFIHNIMYMVPLELRLGWRFM
jgi:hypothetical protein